MESVSPKALVTEKGANCEPGSRFKLEALQQQKPKTKNQVLEQLHKRYYERMAKMNIIYIMNIPETFTDYEAYQLF